MTINVGINGFGRIGRSTLSHINESARNDVHVTKINATGPIQTNAHLLKYDSTHGRFAGDIVVEKDSPVGIKALLSGPDMISIFAAKFSPSENVV